MADKNVHTDHSDATQFYFSSLPKFETIISNYDEEFHRRLASAGKEQEKTLEMKEVDQDVLKMVVQF